MIVPRYYENLSVLHENTMPARAYYIPASKRMDNLVEHREESDRMQLLNGTWKFQYFNSIYDIQSNISQGEWISVPLYIVFSLENIGLNIFESPFGDA